MCCYGCSIGGLPESAIGECAVCGAAVRVEGAQVGSQTIRRMDGFVSADRSSIETRIINCAPRADAVHAHHPAEQGLAPQ